MSCLTTSATRRSRSVPAAVLIASAAASSHDVPLAPMISVTLYTLMPLSFDDLRPGPGLLRPACHRARWQFVDGGKWSRPGWSAFPHALSERTEPADAGGVTVLSC